MSLASSGCGGGADGAVPGEASGLVEGPTLQGLAVSTGELLPAFSPLVRNYSVSSLNALRDLQVTATAEAGATLTLNGQAMTSGVPRTLRLQPGEDLEIGLTSASGARGGYRVSYLPPDFPVFTTWKEAGATLATGLLYLTSTVKGGVGYDLTVDSDGRVLYYQRTGSLTTFDFKKHVLPGAQVRYSSFLEDPNLPQNGTWTRGSVRILDEDFRQIGDVRLLPYAGRPARPVANHDFLLLEEGHYLVLAYETEVVDLSGLDPSWGRAAQVVAGVVQEVKDGQVLLEFRTTDHPELYRDSTEDNSFQDGSLSDYAHVNSVSVDPLDGNLLLSFRHLDEVLKVDRQTGRILWILGGRSDQFGLTDDQKFSHQHHATRGPDGRLLLFDNGNARARTRILEFELDEANRKLLSFREVHVKDPARRCSVFAGSAQDLGGDGHLVGWGGVGWGQGAVGEPNISEIQAGREVWTLRFLGANTFTYRAFKR